jgi:hypothetical protein
VIHPVGMHAYWLHLLASMSWIHPVFRIIKLLPNPPDPIRRTVHKHPAPTIVGGEEHYEVEKVLDNMLMRRLEFLVSWKGYGYKENSWMSEHDVSALGWSHSSIMNTQVRHITSMLSISDIYIFDPPTHCLLSTSGHCALKGGWCKGNILRSLWISCKASKHLTKSPMFVHSMDW